MASNSIQNQIYSGARCLVYVNAKPNPNAPGATLGSGSGNVQSSTSDGLVLAGVFTSVSWQYAYIEQDIDILGRYSPVGIIYTGATTVSGSCTGWRVVADGPFATGLFPTLDQLDNYGDLTFAIIDRQDPTQIYCKITNVKPLNYSSGTANKSASTFSIDFKGLNIEEDGVINQEVNVPNLPA